MYVSSIINKYGDAEKVREDAKVLQDILARQGTTFIIDCLAEYIGEHVNKFELTKVDRENLVNNITRELREALWERV